MLSPSDTIIVFVVALLLFGPEHLPKVARQLGDAMRQVQNTTSTFMAEMDRAAAAAEHPTQSTWSPPPDEPVPVPELPPHPDIEHALPGSDLRAEDAADLPALDVKPNEQSAP